MATKQITVTVDEELAATAKRAAEESGQSMSGFMSTALRSQLIALDAGRLAEFDRSQGYDSAEYAEVMALLALPPEMTGDAA